MIMTDRTFYQTSNTKIFDNIDMTLLFGIQCSSGNQTQQNYFERLKVQTEAAFMNKKFQLN